MKAFRILFFLICFNTSLAFSAELCGGLFLDSEIPLATSDVRHLIRLVSAVKEIQRNQGKVNAYEMSHSLWHLSLESKYTDEDLIRRVEEQSKNCGRGFDCQSVHAWINWSTQYLEFSPALNALIVQLNEISKNHKTQKESEILKLIAQQKLEYYRHVNSTQKAIGGSIKNHLIDAALFGLFGDEFDAGIASARILYDFLNLWQNHEDLPNLVKFALAGNIGLDIILLLAP